MKRCVTCDETKPFSAFNRRQKSPDGRQPRCRDCCRAWYEANKDRHKAAVAVRAERDRRRNRDWVAAFLSDNPCVDCGENDIRCLDFDHRPGEEKRKEIAKLVGEAASIKLIQQEIAKCDVRCANCHRRRTAERGGFWRQAVHEARASQAHETALRRLPALSAAPPS